MRRILLLLTTLIASTMLLISCTPPPANNSANKPANGANTANSGTATAADAAAIEAEIKKKLDEVAAALSKSDADALDKYYADNYTLVNTDGSVQNRADRLASIKSGVTKIESFVYSEVTVRSNPEGTGAVVIAKADLKGTNNGKSAASPIRVTQVWTKTKDGWKMASGHATAIIASATTTASNTTVNSNSNSSANAAK